VTQEEPKIMKNFELFIKCFSQLSKLMKYGNHCVFLADLEQILLDGDKVVISDIPSNVVPSIIKELQQLKRSFFFNIGQGEANFELNEEIIENFMVNIFSNETKQLPSEFVALLDKGLNNSSQLLSQYIPLILKKIHKKSGYEKKLRTFPEIVKPLYEPIIDLAHYCLNHFSRPSHVIDRSLEDIGEFYGPKEDILFIGGVYVLEFGLCNHFNRPGIFGNIPSLSAHSSPISSARMNESPPIRDIPIEFANIPFISPAPRNTLNDEEASNFTSPQFFTPFTPANFHSFPNNEEKAKAYFNIMTHSPPLLLNYRGQGSYISQIFSTQSGQTIQSLNTKLPKNNSENSLQTMGRTNSKLFSEKQSFKTFVHQLSARYSFAKDIVYSILIGIPVIIFGSEKTEHLVVNFVNTLRPFVPGLKPNDIASVIPWRTTPIGILELSKLKLIGMPKKVELSKSLEPFVSNLDLEEQIFYGPPYKGEFLEKIFSANKFWPNEETLMSYIHYQFLNWGAKAALYYHLSGIGSIRMYYSPSNFRTVNTSKLDNLNQSSGSHWSKLLRRTKKHKKRRVIDTVNITIPSTQPKNYVSPQSSSISLNDLERISDVSKTVFTYLGVTKRCDMNIIEYLADVVKQQQRNLFDINDGCAPKYSMRLTMKEKVKIPNSLQPQKFKRKSG
jgi:hypothetical protein